MSDAGGVTAGAAIVCGLAVAHGLGPQMAAVVDGIVVGLVAGGLVAGAVAHQVRIRRIRRDIEAGGSAMRRVYYAEPERRTARPPVCPRPQTGRRPTPTCRSG